MATLIVAYVLMACSVNPLTIPLYLGAIGVYPSLFLTLYAFVKTTGPSTELKSTQPVFLATGVLGFATLSLLYTIFHPLNPYQQFLGYATESASLASRSYLILSAAIFCIFLFHQLIYRWTCVNSWLGWRYDIAAPILTWGFTDLMVSEFVFFQKAFFVLSPPSWLVPFIVFVRGWCVWWACVLSYAVLWPLLLVWVGVSWKKEVWIRNVLLAAATLLFFLLLILPFYAYPLTALTAASVATIALTTAIAIKYGRTTNPAK